MTVGVEPRCGRQLWSGLRPLYPLGLNLPAHSVDNPGQGACSPEYMEKMLSGGKCAGK